MQLTKQEAEIHRKNGGETSFEWGSVDLSDESFPIQVEIATTCIQCKGSLANHPTWKREQGIICWDCYIDSLTINKKENGLPPTSKEVGIRPTIL